MIILTASEASRKNFNNSNKFVPDAFLRSGSAPAKNTGVVVDLIVKNKLQKFKLPPLTRWQYLFEMTNSLISLRSKMTEICSPARFDNLTISQYEKI